MPSPWQRRTTRKRSVPLPAHTAELISAYQRSSYVCPSLRLNWRIGGSCHGRHGAILGAWNPHSQRQGLWRNLRADRQLERRLRRVGRGAPVTVWGGCASWWEQHYFAAGLDPRTACWLAGAMRQNAWLWLDGRRVFLVCCAEC
ncbi:MULTISPECIES: DUF3293 domain-containing protein [Acidithiobacillus]|nr:MULTISPECIES: DUF3293 domain-containing protein [Acidithiobacillus]MCY0871481.1 DUF3293 domain-containing protein [Acidithiobacillus caldus]WMT47424.1 MAG: DUF3293 domain-containing protein [Acidithiobacillus caldus]